MKKLEFFNYLLKTFGVEKPIFIGEIKIKDLEYCAIRKQVQELVKEGKLINKSRGVYFIPKKNEYNLPSMISFEDIYVKKYIKDDKEVYGYYSGLWLENKLGISTQVPNVITIFTNKETNIKRVTNINGWKIVLKKPYVQINKNNYKVLQFLEILRSLVDKDFYEHIDIVIKAKESSDISEKEIEKYIGYFPKFVLKRYQYIKENINVFTR